MKIPNLKKIRIGTVVNSTLFAGLIGAAATLLAPVVDKMLNGPPQTVVAEHAAAAEDGKGAAQAETKETLKTPSEKAAIGGAATSKSDAPVCPQPATASANAEIKVYATHDMADDIVATMTNGNLFWLGPVRPQSNWRYVCRKSTGGYILKTSDFKSLR